MFKLRRKSRNEDKFSAEEAPAPVDYVQTCAQDSPVISPVVYFDRNTSIPPPVRNTFRKKNATPKNGGYRHYSETTNPRCHFDASIPTKRNDCRRANNPGSTSVPRHKIPISQVPNGRRPKYDGNLPRETRACRPSAHLPSSHRDSSRLRTNQVSSTHDARRENRTKSPPTSSVLLSTQKLKDKALNKAKCGEWDESKDILLRVLILEKSTLRGDHLDIGNTLHHLGMAYNWLGDFKLALNSFDEAYRIRLMRLGEQHRDVASTLHYIGMIEGMAGNYGKAIHHLSIAEKIQRGDNQNTSQMLRDFQRANKSSQNYAFAA